MTILVAPSILSADFGRLKDEIAAVEAAGADLIHVDVMDGHFVPNITIGPDVVKAVRRCTKLPLDVHLMIENPAKYIESFAVAGADMISVHVEACDLEKTLPAIKKLKCKAGAVLNPPTDVGKILPFVEYADFVLVMTVNPGFSGQELIPACIEKIRRLRKLKTLIEVDGGIKPENIKSVIDAGADMVVAGSSVFGKKDYAAAISALKVTSS